jgi:hypothetical protein
MSRGDIIGDRKRCANCRRWLNKREFRANPKLRGGLDSWCRECHRAATRDWRRRRAQQAA